MIQYNSDLNHYDLRLLKMEADRISIPPPLLLPNCSCCLCKLCYNFLRRLDAVFTFLHFHFLPDILCCPRHQEVDSACHPSEVGKMSTGVLVRGTLHQRHSRVPTNDATSSHRLHSIERENVYMYMYMYVCIFI